MPSTSITRLVQLLKAGDGDAARGLWDEYFRRLVGLARKKLGGARRRAADEEDVALSAFASLCRGAANGRFPHLEDRNGLWRLLMVITTRKALDQAAHERRQKRGGGRVDGDSAVGGDWEQVVGGGPTPDDMAELADECRRLFALLPDVELRLVALGKMEGFTDEEVAARLGKSLRTAQRKIELIRKIWNQEAGA